MEKFLDERLQLFPLVQTIEDPDRRSRAYVAVRDAGTEEDLARYGDYLRTIGGDVAKQMDLAAFREKTDEVVSQIANMPTRLKAIKAVSQATDIATLRKLSDRAEEILAQEGEKDGSRVQTGQELVETVRDLFE